MSRLNEAIVVAWEKGYRVSPDGSVTSPLGVNLKLYKDARGYYKFGIAMGARRIQISVHRQQAFQKFGNAIFKKGIQVRHLDCDSENNGWENIAIGTQSDNMMDNPAALRSKRAAHAASKRKGAIPPRTLKKIIKDHAAGMSYKALMEKYNISSKGTLAYQLSPTAKHRRK